jgi:hypothetical protein
LIPFRPDSPALNVENIFRPTSIPQVDRFTLASNSYEYQYLSITSDQIRLLVLHKGSPDKDIHCSLKPIHASELEGSPLGYYALSYAWGQRRYLEKIYVSNLPAVNDIPSQAPPESLPPKTLSIQTNLHAALKQLRCDDKDVWFWIDAICIDQQNISEKSHQLPKMMNIYENAYSVCVWLGEPEIDARLNNTCRDPLDFVSVIVNLKFLDHIVREPIAETEEILASFVAFASLLKRPWFRRRWVIQEVAASKRAFVQVGLKKVNWVDFADAVQLFLANIERIRVMYERSELSRRDPDALGHVESVGAGAIVRATSHVLKRSDEGRIVARLCTIEALVVTFLHYEASDTRDTIYALLSLAKDRDSYLGAQRLLGFPEQPPYEKSTAQVYAEFVHHCIHSSNSLDIICRHWALPSADLSGPKVPSWAGVVTDSSFGPSPRATGRLNGDSLVGKSGNRIYNASGGSNPRVMLWTSRTLVASGFRLCQITQRSPRVVDGVIAHECLEIAGWNRGLDINDIPDRLWRTLVADRTDDGSNALSWWRRACMYCLSRTTTQYGDLNTSKLIANQSLPETVSQFLRRVQANVWNRSFFVGQNLQDSSDRMYGLGSRYIQLGDWCCILFGCSVPVILREQERRLFEFIGECYVDGMMDGQAMDFMKDRDIVPTRFFIR